jgi:ABC-2 type transport system permease protein/oleandomycin transport system permease protein
MSTEASLVTLPADPLSRIRRAVGDTMVLAWRYLLHYVRQPDLLFFSTVQPVMFVLLFNYVFGGAIGSSITQPGIDYTLFFIPGILIQTIAFASSTPSVSMAKDRQEGISDRFRSLPMAPGAVLAGRVLADTVYLCYTALLLTGIGLVIGFRFQTGWAEVLAGFGMAVLFGFSLLWVAILVGLLVRNVDAANLAGFVWLFPVTFASSAFVPVDTLPDGLRQFAEYNPVSFFVDSVRGLWLGGLDSRDVVWAIGWAIVLTVVFAPLGVWRYRRAR